jgi:hypothetical protein
MHNTKSSKTFYNKETQMKKLLLGIAISLTTLTATLYATCTQNVDMNTTLYKTRHNLGNT